MLFGPVPNIFYFFYTYNITYVLLCTYFTNFLKAEKMQLWSFPESYSWHMSIWNGSSHLLPIYHNLVRQYFNLCKTLVI